MLSLIVGAVYAIRTYGLYSAEHFLSDTKFPIGMFAFFFSIVSGLLFHIRMFLFIVIYQ